MIVIVGFGLHFGLATIPRDSSDQGLNSTILPTDISLPRKSALPTEMTMAVSNASELVRLETALDYCTSVCLIPSYGDRRLRYELDK